MSDTNRKTGEVDPAVVTTLFEKRDRLLAERIQNRQDRAALAARDREIDRDLADIQAAGRVFGVTVEVPEDEETRRMVVNLAPGSGATHALRTIQEWFRPATTRTQPTEPPAQADSTSPAEKAVATKAELPRVSDIVLDQLKAAGERGSKASAIQTYIQTTYDRKIHDKTVGMTLYRLQKEELVRRDGHTWFITEKGMNPGAVTPGPDNLL